MQIDTTAPKTRPVAPPTNLGSTLASSNIQSPPVVEADVDYENTGKLGNIHWFRREAADV